MKSSSNNGLLWNGLRPAAEPHRYRSETMKYSISVSEDGTYVAIRVFEAINGDTEKEFAKISQIAYQLSQKGGNVKSSLQ